MKASDVIAQLAATLPRNSPFFSNISVPDSITLVGNLVTVHTSAPHKISAAGDSVCINGILTPVSISSQTVNSDGTISFVCATAHDLTMNVVDPVQYVRITGTAYDKTFQLSGVPNRFKFNVIQGSNTVPPAGAVLQQAFLYGYNGTQIVTAVSDSYTFQFSLSEIFPAPTIFTGAVVNTNVRISGAVSIDVLIASYDKQGLDEVWAFVVLDDVQGNKDRKNPMDSVYVAGQNADYNQRMIQGFKVYLFVPNKGEILTKTNGRAARDLIEDIRLPLFNSLLGIDFSTSLASGGQNVCTWAGDRFYSYTGAYYIHEFSFQQVVDITYGDTAIVSDSRAFRDISLDLLNQFSTVTTYSVSIDLDDKP